MWHKPIGVRLGATILFALALMLAGSLPVRAAAMSPKPPAIGDKARDFTLGELGGAPLRLAEVNKSGPVVIVMLRGYPGYQCPLCTRQVGEFIESADEFAKLGATVLFVYPGPCDELAARAAEFVKGKDYPAHFRILLDPDYVFTRAYGLRWDAPNETSYPSTFVLDAKRKVRFAKISKGHGDRAKVEDVLRALHP